MIPVKILFTLLITKYTVGPRPMNVWLLSYPFRLLFCLAMVLIVYVTPMFAVEEEDVKSFSVGYYAFVIGVFALHRVSLYAMFVAIMAFFARISDPAVGGTYMTFLNTLTNLGNMWPNSFTLWFVDIITNKNCRQAEVDIDAPLLSINNNTTTLAELVAEGNVCYGTSQVEACKDVGGECNTITDGYFGLSIACVVIGFIWFVWGLRTIRKLQEIDVSEWRVVKKTEAEDKKEDKEKFKFFYCF